MEIFIPIGVFVLILVRLLIAYERPKRARRRSPGEVETSSLDKKVISPRTGVGIFSSGAALAHQPVVLLSTDTTAATGPLLVDGTVSFALRAAFAKAGRRKLFGRNLRLAMPLLFST